MPDLHAMIEAMTPAEQAIACRVLDAVSRPLRTGEILSALRARGMPRRHAVKVANAIHHLTIVAVVGPEGEAGR